MSNTILYKRRETKLGLLFYIPLWILASLGFMKLLSVFILSFTDYNCLVTPNFTGFENYKSIMANDITEIILDNTVTLVITTALLLIVFAVIPALFISKIHTVFGMVIIGGFSLVSFTAMLPGTWSYIYSGDSLGYINSLLLSIGAISEPVLWSHTEAKALSVMLFFLICIAPIFAIVYVSARLKKGRLGTMLGLCLTPVLMFIASRFTTQLVGYPSIDYSADWLAGTIYDYLKVRFEAGYAYALCIIGIFMLVFWCGFCCGAVYGISCIIKHINCNLKAFKIVGYILLGVCGFVIISSIIPLILNLTNSMKPLDEIFEYPPSVFVKRPTFSNFSSLSSIYGNWKLLDSLSGIKWILLIYIAFILPCAAGLALFKSSKKELILLLPLIGLLFFNPNLHPDFNSAKIITNEFLSGIGIGALLFLSFIIIRLIFAVPHGRKKRIVLGVFGLLSLAFAVGSIGIVLSSQTQVNILDYSWLQMNSMIASGGIARMGSIGAANILLLLFCVAVLLPPVILFILVYLNLKKELKNERT